MTPPDASEASSPHHRLKLLSFALLLAACYIDGCDVQILPACFKALETDLGFAPANLGQLAMMQALFMGSFAPVWGSVADKGILSKKALLAGNVASWGVLTMMQSTVSSFYAMAILRAAIGACLACIYPLSQTLVAADVDSQSRGRIFGWVHFCWYMGQVTSLVFGTSISNESFSVAGKSVMGWRLAYFTVGAISLAIAVMILLFLEELPQRSSRANQDSILTDIFSRARSYFTIPTFRIIVLQGLFGSTAGQALGFLAMFFQYVGFQATIAAFLVTLFISSQAIGSMLGGHIGDVAAQCSKQHGRIIVGQMSMFFAIPCFVLMLYFIPPDTSSFTLYAGVLSCYGISAYWTMSAAKRPMLSEIVRREDWASIFALDTAFETSCAAILGAPLVGMLAESVFGYIPMRQHVSQIPHAVRAANTHALLKGMLWMTIVPQVMCLTIWSLLHFTYPKDIDAIQGDQDVENEFEEKEIEKDFETTPLLSKDDDGCTAGTY